MRRRGCGIGIVAALAIVVLCAGCAPLPWQPSATISGRVEGQTAADALAGKTTVTGLPATITCAGNSTTANAQGHFSLTIVRAHSYDCTVTLAGYVTTSTTLTGGSAQALTLNLTASPSASCLPTNGAASNITCPQLALTPVNISGNVTRSGQPYANATINCQDANGSYLASPYHATTNSGGAYTMTDVPPSIYGCWAQASDGATAYQKISARPGGTATANFSLCTGRCGRVPYQGGQVMHKQDIYVIYWQPAGTHFDPAGDAKYQQAMAQYFQDVGGTPFYGMLTQYFDYTGYIQNSVTYRGTNIDTAPFEHCLGPGDTTHCKPATATTSDPLRDIDVQAEIDRVIAQQHWATSDNTLVYLYLPQGAASCQSVIQGYGQCDYPTGGPQGLYWCGYHSIYTNPRQQNVTYAIIADPLPYCSLSYAARDITPPHGDWAIDSALDATSHEEFEAATDPNTAVIGWMSTSQADLDLGGEIGDICDPFVGEPGAFARIVTLHGHAYYLQSEWSDAAGNCVLPS